MPEPVVQENPLRGQIKKAREKTNGPGDERDYLDGAGIFRGRKKSMSDRNPRALSGV